MPYTYWKKITSGKGLGYDSTLEEVMDQTHRLRFFAVPVENEDPTSPWLTARWKALKAIRKVLGSSAYQAHAGVTTWANGVYWLEVISERPDGLMVVRNVTEGTKRKVEQIITELEPDLVYPLLRGRDVQRWHAQPSLHILMVQDPKTRRGIDEKVLQRQYPKTWSYLKRFEKTLRERSGFKRYFTRKDKNGRIVETGPFYSMFNVSDYTFAPWKVVWPNMGNRINAAVISSVNEKPILPQHIISLVPLDNAVEAHYISALINSIPFQFAAHAYSQVGGKSFGTPEVLEKIRIPRFNSADAIHSMLSRLSRRAHVFASRAYRGDGATLAELEEVEAEINRAAARLWNLTEEELREIQASFEELK